MIVANCLDPAREIEVLGSFEASETLRAEAFWGEVFEAVSSGPLKEECIGLGVAAIAIFQSFCEHVRDSFS